MKKILRELERQVKHAEAYLLENRKTLSKEDVKACKKVFQI